MRLQIVAAFLLGGFWIAPAPAQTFSPKVIRFEGVQSFGQSDLLAVCGLKPGTALTPADISAGLQRLADTGLFAESKYTITPAELRITLTPIAASATLPARYGNFVWWAPGELTPLVHARVPLFHGTLPLDGNVSDDVKKALQALMLEKGLGPAVVEMRSSTDGMGGPVVALTFSVVDPQVKVGDIRFDGASAEAAPQLAKLQSKLAEDDFDSTETPRAVVNDTEQIYRDDGYLDVAVGAPVAGAPRKLDAGRWLVDLSAHVQGGELYRVADVTLQAAPPLQQETLRKVIALKPGDPASAAAFRNATNALVGPYRRAGYLDAKDDATVAKNTVAHTAAYTFKLTAGEVYHVASVRTTGMTTEQQEVCARVYAGAVGAVYDETFTRRAADAQHNPAFSGLAMRSNGVVDRPTHTVAVTLSAVRAPAK